MKILYFKCRGKWYKVKNNGNMIQENNIYNSWNNSWQFLGISKHHWKRSIDINCQEAFKKPESIIGGIVWDKDHGTTRLWGGCYNGKLPRIENVYIKEVK